MATSEEQIKPGSRECFNRALELYTQLISTTPDFIAFVDLEHRYQIINDRYIVATGLTKNAIIGSHVRDVIGKEIYDSSGKTAIEQCFTGQTIEYEGWFSYTAIGRRYIKTRLMPHRSLEGNIEGALVYSRDITDQKIAEDKNIEAEAMFRQMFEGHESPMLLLDLQTGLIRDANQQACNFFICKHEDILNTSANSLAPSTKGDSGTFDRLLGGFTDHDQNTISLSDNSIKEIEIQSIPIWVDNEANLCLVIRDITTVAENQRELSTIFKNSQVGIAMMGPNRTIAKCNQKLCDIFGYDHSGELINSSTAKLHFQTPESAKFVETYRAKLSQGEQVRGDLKMKRKDGTAVWCSLSANALDTHIPPDLNKGILWVVDDITQRKAIEGMLQKIASKDGLTGIYSRTYFMEMGKKLLHQSQQHNQPFSMILLDVDKFKSVNDTHGHPAGDKVLKTITQRANRTLRKSDEFGRMGGEEFAVLLPDTSIENTNEIAERIRQEIQNSPIMVGPKQLNITISLGIATATPQLTSLDQLITAADKALYHAKEAGRNQVCSYHNFCLL